MNKFQTQLGQFEKALSRFREVLQRPEDDVVRDSAIQRFEFTLDLSWKCLKTYLEEKKGVIVASPKDCFRAAYKQGIISYDEAWIGLVDTRNATVHTYDEKNAQEIFDELPDALQHFESLLEVLKK